MRPKTQLTTLLLAITPLLFAVACDSGGQSTKCSDVQIAEGCKLRCTRVAVEADKRKICGKSLMLTGDGSNSILQRKTKRIEFRQLGQERCFEVTPEGAMAVASEQALLAASCDITAPPSSQPAKTGY